MPRYIDADQIDYTVTVVGVDENAGYRAVAFESDVDEMPTADVVPRAEYERLQGKVNRLKKYDEERDIRLHARLIANAKSEVAKKILDEIEEEIVAALESNYRARGELLVKKDIPYEMVACINGKINALRGIEGFVEELKEKYTKGDEGE